MNEEEECAFEPLLASEENPAVVIPFYKTNINIKTHTHTTPHPLPGNK